MTTFSPRLLNALSLSLLLALTACSKDEPTPRATAEAPAAAPTRQVTDPATLAKVAETQRRARLPQPDASVPIAQYTELASGNQLMYLYHALSGMPIDHAAAASEVSREYNSTSDSFRKRDLLAALKPRIDASVADAAGQPYIRIDISASSQLGKYDFERKGFALKALNDASTTRYFQDNSRYQLGFSNTDAYSFLPVSDEAQARQIEQVISKYETMVLRVYAFANDADTATQHIKSVITRVVLTDRAGKTLADFSAKP